MLATANFTYISTIYLAFIIKIAFLAKNESLQLNMKQ